MSGRNVLATNDRLAGYMLKSYQAVLKYCERDISMYYVFLLVNLTKGRIRCLRRDRGWKGGEEGA
jgi:hypothetical protein